jgi:phytoene synthase
MVLDEAVASGFAELAGHAGCAQAMTGLLLLLPLHRARRQCFIPADILAAVGTSREEVLAGDVGGERAVAALIALAREHFSAFETGAATLPSSLRAAYLPLALSGAYLDRMESARVSPLHETVRLSGLRRHWLLFRYATRGWG